MMSDYNTKLSQLAGLATAFASEIQNDQSLKEGEKFLLLQRFFCDIKPLEKVFKEQDNFFKDWAKNNLKDGDIKEFEGVEVTIKYNKPPAPALDANLVYNELERVYSELNYDIDKTRFLTQREPAKKITIQSIIKK